MQHPSCDQAQWPKRVIRELDVGMAGPALIPRSSHQPNFVAEQLYNEEIGGQRSAASYPVTENSVKAPDRADSQHGVTGGPPWGQARCEAELSCRVSSGFGLIAMDRSTSLIYAEAMAY